MANFYRVTFQARAYKDEHNGIHCYVIAESNEQVFDFLSGNGDFSNHKLSPGLWFMECAEYLADAALEHDDTILETDEDVRAYLIKHQGDYWHYTYGEDCAAVNWGWNTVRENVTDDQIETLTLFLKNEIADIRGQGRGA